MSDFTCDIPWEKQLDVFYPMLLDISKTLTDQFSQTIKVDLSTSPWWLIQDNRTKLDFLRPHALEPSWSSFQQYFLGHQNLFFFLEEPILGIVHKKANFWLFFDPRLAASYFHRQTERPKKFTKDYIKKFPTLDVLAGLTSKVRDAVKSQEEKTMNTQQLEELIAIADKFLPEERSIQFTEAIRKILIALSLSEVRSLLNDITNPGISPNLLEKRLKTVYRFCLKLYAVKQDEHEREMLKKLLSPKITIRQRVLEVIEERLSKDAG